MVSVFIMIGSLLFSAGVAWGISQAGIKALNRRIDGMQKQLDGIGDADKITRSYLFKDDGTSVYMPMTACLRAHDAVNVTLSKISDKIDEILKAQRG